MWPRRLVAADRDECPRSTSPGRAREPWHCPGGSERRRFRDGPPQAALALPVDRSPMASLVFDRSEMLSLRTQGAQRETRESRTRRRHRWTRCPRGRPQSTSRGRGRRGSHDKSVGWYVRPTVVEGGDPPMRCSRSLSGGTPSVRGQPVAHALDSCRQIDRIYLVNANARGQRERPWSTDPAALPRPVAVEPICAGPAPLDGTTAQPLSRAPVHPATVVPLCLRGAASRGSRVRRAWRVERR